MRVLNWAKAYSSRFGRPNIDEHDILKALVMVPDSVASAVLDAMGLSEAVRTHFNLKPLDIQVQTLSDEDLGVRGYGSIVYAQTYADDSGSSKINTGHLLLAVTVLCATVIPYDGVEEHQKQTIRTICRLVRDITPKHKEIAETDDLQIPVSPAAQQMVVLPPKPQSEDGPVKLQPAERVVTPEAFVGIIGPLCAAFPRGFESVHLQTLLAAALEAYEPSDLALTLEDLVSVMRLLGWKNVARFAGLIKRLAKQRNVSVQTVQERYNSITGPVTQETHGEIGILLQILSGNPPRKLGEPIDWLKNNRQEQKPEGSLPEWP
jgi:hypothetical protein